MDSSIVNFFGTLGTIITSVQFVPQVFKTYKERSSKGLSVGMLSTCFTGCLVWIVYGIFISSGPIIITNGIVSCLVGSLLIAKKVFK